MKKIIFLLSLLLVGSVPIQGIDDISSHWVRVAPPMIALTFDDGPRPENTPPLLEILSRYGAKATFFVVGQMAAKSPDLIKQMAAAGHEIANHTWSHPDIRHLRQEEFVDELDKTRALIAALTGHDTWLFRAPGGTRAYLEQKLEVPAGYRMVLWDIHSLDQQGLSSAEIKQRVLTQARPGTIVLLHNGLSTTVKALETVLPVLQEKGFQFVTVSELLKKNGGALLVVKKSDLSRG